MAIFTNVYGDGHTPDYEGCVLDWYEHNGYDDSDWYAICWNISIHAPLAGCDLY